MLGAPLRQLDFVRIEADDGPVADEIAQTIHRLRVDAESLLPLARNGCFQTSQVSETVSNGDLDSTKILFEMHEFPVATSSRRATEREISQGLEEVGLPLSIPSQKDIDLGRNVQLDLF
jgi:hypothetical protein